MTFWRVSLSFELYGIRELKKISKIYFDKSWIINSVRNWRKQPFASPTLNPIWQLWPSFTIWETRKERNCRIFQNKDSTRDLIWAKVRSNIYEAFRLTPWKVYDFQCNQTEVEILGNCRFDIRLGAQGTIVSNILATTHPSGLLPWRTFSNSILEPLKVT